MQVGVDRPKRQRGKNGVRVEDFAQQSVHRLAVLAYKVRCPTSSLSSCLLNDYLVTSRY